MNMFSCIYGRPTYTHKNIWVTYNTWVLHRAAWDVRGGWCRAVVAGVDANDPLLRDVLHLESHRFESLVQGWGIVCGFIFSRVFFFHLFVWFLSSGLKYYTFLYIIHFFILYYYREFYINSRTCTFETFLGYSITFRIGNRLCISGTKH